MRDGANSWLWFVDDDLVRSLLNVEPENPDLARRAALHPAVVEAVRLRLDGSNADALARLKPPCAAGDADALLLAGQIQFELERFEDAEASYRKLAEIRPDSVAGMFNLALCQARRRNWPEAAESFRRALVLDAERPESWFSLGVCLLNADHAVEAKAAFQRCLKVNPGYTPALFGQAAALQLEGRLEDALAIYEQLLEAYPHNAELIENTLTAAAGLRDPFRVRPLAMRMLEIDPHNRAALAALASSAMDSNDIDDAEEWLEELARLPNATFEHYYNLAVCQHRMGKIEVAAGNYERAVAMEPEDADAWAGLAACRARGNDDSKTMQALDTLVRLRPEREDAWFHLGLLRHARGDWKQALAAFEHALSLRPEWPDAWLNLGLLRRDAGETVSAAAAFDKALTLNPKSAGARRAAAALAIDRGDVVAAAHYFQGLGPESWDIAYNMAVLYERDGDLDTAETLYREVLMERPNCAEARFNLGGLLFAVGRQKEAGECWRVAMEQRPELAHQFLETGG